MNEVLKYKMVWLVRVFFILVSFFIFQSSVISVTASPIILAQSHHTGTSEIHTYDEIESSAHVEVNSTGGLSRVLSGKEVRPERQVLAGTVSVAVKSSTATARSLGIAGERAVGITGPKTAINVAGRTRIPDALTSRTLTEVKNVKSLSFTRQLRDFHTFSQQNRLDFILYTRSNTTLSGPCNKRLITDQSFIELFQGYEKREYSKVRRSVL